MMIIDVQITQHIIRLETCHILRSNRVRRHVRIQSLPQERHALRQAVRIEMSGRHLPAEVLHAVEKGRRRLLRGRVHARQHRLVVEHVHQRAVGSDEERPGKESREPELGLDFDERREVLSQVRGSLGGRRWLVQRWRVEGERGTDRDQFVGVDGVVRGGGEVGLEISSNSRG